jgi:hypothetical protein
MFISEITKLKYTIYCDLDGVIVDFDKFCREHIGIRPRDMDTDKTIKREFWKRVKRWVENGNGFFSQMDPMIDASLLWGYIKKYDPIILSAAGTATKNAVEEKAEWVRLHLGPKAAKQAIFVTAATDKAQYAASNHILIDDRDRAINPWVAAGGVGILHTSAENTIRQLRELGL